MTLVSVYSSQALSAEYATNFVHRIDAYSNLRYRCAVCTAFVLQNPCVSARSLFR